MTAENRWPFDDECPKCGEDEELSARVIEQVDGEFTEAEMYCGTGLDDLLEGVKEGCGHTWEWNR